MIDSLLLIQESIVARDRERSVRLIIESSSQADLKEISIEDVSTQRNSSQFEMIENIVLSKKQAFVRNRVITRERDRERKRDRERERDRERNRERDDKTDINTSTKDVSETIQ